MRALRTHSNISDNTIFSTSLGLRRFSTLFPSSILSLFLPFHLSSFFDQEIVDLFVTPSIRSSSSLRVISSGRSHSRQRFFSFSSVIFVASCPPRRSGCVRRYSCLNYMLLRRYLTPVRYLDRPLRRYLHHLHLHTMHLRRTVRLTNSVRTVFVLRPGCHNSSRDSSRFYFFNRPTTRQTRDAC